jgi:hypothetical protein
MINLGDQRAWVLPPKIRARCQSKIGLILGGGDEQKGTGVRQCQF